MKLHEIEKYRFFYQSVYENDAASIFNRYLGFDNDQIVPLGIAHGVDFEHCHEAMDIYSLAPIHWSYNRRIHARAKKVKPTLLIPHPWSIVASQNKFQEGEGVLIIGPPPGRQNDLNLYNLIRNDIKSDWSILVKGKAGSNQSIDFWESKGVKAVAIANNTNSFYLDLYLLLSSYKHIVGCTFSSALIFAASIDKSVSLIYGYQYSNYDTSDYLDKVNFNSDYAKYVVSTFVHSDKDSISELSRNILGFDLIQNSSEIRSDFFKLLESLDRPVMNINGFKSYWFRLYLSRLIKKPGIINKKFKSIAVFNQRKIFEMTLDEISIWIDGVDKKNAIFRKVEYKSGVTVPGNAVDSY